MAPEDNYSPNLKRFRAWLEKKTNLYAERCAEWTRSAGESPPESLNTPYIIYRSAWDGMCIILEKDNRYRTSRDLEMFLSGSDDSTPEYELYLSYLEFTRRLHISRSSNLEKIVNEIVSRFQKDVSSSSV